MPDKVGLDGWDVDVVCGRGCWRRRGCRSAHVDVDVGVDVHVDVDVDVVVDVDVDVM